ncbi:MAG TPA: hypothetical protein VJ741_17315 [Solirubrobacteraceae bacterium]|nr:hypothetical protein [Solirubrobacteraceae bacterium]
MPRPRVILSILFVLLVLALGLRPAVLHLGSARHTARPAAPLRTQVHDAVDAYSTGR